MIFIFITSTSSEIQGIDLEKKVENCFDDLENPFSVSAVFEEEWEIVEPVESVLCVRFDV